MFTIPATRSRAARTVAGVLIQLMPTDGSIDGLVTAVGRLRGRPIDVISAPLGSRSRAGFWVAGTDRDYLVHAASASAEERQRTICHELAHLLLGHALGPGPAASGARSPMPTTLLTRHGYSPVQEAEADRMARLITTLASVRRRARRRARRTAVA